ncbi:transposase [Candidatus Fermentibacterales bacterium]|nr:transposase [Candidatus Fermentibacterales bacterium]
MAARAHHRAEASSARSASVIRSRSPGPHFSRGGTGHRAGTSPGGWAIHSLACEHGSYVYRRATEVLRRESWLVNHKRVERIRRREGLKVARKQTDRIRRQAIAISTTTGRVCRDRNGLRSYCSRCRADAEAVVLESERPDRTISVYQHGCRQVVSFSIYIHPPTGVVHPERIHLLSVVAHEYLVEGRDMGMAVDKGGYDFTFIEILRLCLSQVVLHQSALRLQSLDAVVSP